MAYTLYVLLGENGNFCIPADDLAGLCSHQYKIAENFPQFGAQYLQIVQISLSQAVLLLSMIVYERLVAAVLVAVLTSESNIKKDDRICMHFHHDSGNPFRPTEIRIF